MFESERQDVWLRARKMWESGLVVASAGNVSRRAGENLVAITPTSIPYETMEADDIVLVDLETGNPTASRREPSYELPMHLAIYRARAEVQAIVHTHAPFITTLSVMRQSLPPIIDEMMVYFGGRIEVAEYAFTGTTELGENVVRALGDRPGAMLANHGNVCIAPTLQKALQIAVVMESCARVYVQALAAGRPVPLSDEALAAGRALHEKRR